MCLCVSGGAVSIWMILINMIRDEIINSTNSSRALEAYQKIIFQFVETFLVVTIAGWGGEEGMAPKPTE